MISNASGGDGAHSNEAAGQRGGGGGGSARGLKKGPWTAAEDAILMEYVKKHGEGNWNAVQKNSGLARCGKSCRLRWANHLRPNLKKGSLTPDEERIIIELHAKIGNKWARMASQLPGRTDNEIKNYWNTRMKRRQRAGLPIYPHELQQEAAAAAAANAAFHHHQQQQQQLHHQQQHQQRLHSSSSSSFSSLLSSHPHCKPSNNYTTTTPSSLSLYDHLTAFSSDHAAANNPLHHNNSSLYTANAAAMAQFNGGSNGGFAMPLSPVSQFGSSSSPLFNQRSVPNQTLLTPSLQYNSGGFGNYNPSLSSMIMGPPYEPSTAHVIPGSEPELPSNQTPPYSTTRPSSSNGAEGPMFGASGIANVNHENRINAAVSGQTGNSGLLDDVLVEAQNRSNKRSRSCEDESSSGLSAKDKGAMGREYSTDEHDQEAEDNVQVESSALKINSSENNSADQNQRDDKLSSSPPSIGMKASEEEEDPLEEMDDDLLSLLNFPSTMPAVSDQSWYLGCSATSNRPASSSCPSTNENHYMGLDIQQNVPLESTLPVKSSSTSAAPDHHEVERNSTQLGSSSSCYWNNMPGIC